MKESNCIKIYADYFKIQVKEGYHIHHIDFNPENNDIENLLLLPDDLHRRLHKVKNEYGALIDGQTNVLGDITSPFACSIMSLATYQISWIYQEISTWVNTKRFEQEGISIHPYSYKKFRSKS